MLCYQVNRILSKRYVLYNFPRCIHSEQSRKVLYPLESRKLLKIKGNDASVFLQGLITNDMRHFEEGSKSIYTMFLNNKGRVLYDSLIHKWEGDDSFMIECDKNIISALQKHLKLFKLKRKVDIEDVNEDFKVWALISPLKSIPDSKIDPKSEVNIYKDPRLIDLGFRVLTTSSLIGSQAVQIIGKNITLEDSEEGYRYLRYKLGVSEGSEDLPPASCFPLEVNCDYLHGVSFHKGCYIGQELTARVHHTGVVRKRIMPVKFNEEIKETLEKDAVIVDSEKPKSNVGKLKSSLRNYGLGLVRIKEALDAKSLKIANYTVEVVKPNWWPVEAPKEKITTIKVE